MNTMKRNPLDAVNAWVLVSSYGKKILCAFPKHSHSKRYVESIMRASDMLTEGHIALSVDLTGQRKGKTNAR